MESKPSMNEDFINKVTNILDENLENDKFGVKELAENLAISRSKLHRKLNIITGKSTSQFIREYRLDKAMLMLQNNEATASEIAYRVGFGSPTYFNTSFNRYYGYPPGEVKYRVENGTIENTIISKSRASTKVSNTNLRRGVFGVGLLIIVSLLALYFLRGKKVNDSTKSDVTAETEIEKTIAVLPFKNLSNDESNRYFADGIREDIINHLSKMQKVTVKFRQTSDRYGSSVLLENEIGKVLDVNYIIEGSVQKFEDRIKIIVHLINAKNDTHLWSQDFERRFEDIFQLESEVSSKIASELNLVLTPNEIQEIRKIPTQSTEAYNLYLKGRHFLNSYTEDSYSLSEKYFRESIALDPEFALPYSGLAELILHHSFPRISEEDYLKAKEYALKALRLDDDLSDTHRVMGRVYAEYDWDWEAAEKEFKIALRLNPNNSEANVVYAIYLMYVKGDYKMSRAYVEKAKVLAPVTYFYYVLSAEGYLQEGNYDLALEEVANAVEINAKDLWAPWIKFLALVKQGKDDLAIKELVSTWNLYPEFRVNVDPVLEAYDKEGINGVFQWINKLDIKYGEDERTFFKYHSYIIAQKFAFIGEYDKAMKWLEIAYDRKNHNLFWVKYDHFFNDLHNDPRFLAFLQKMNLGDYSQEFKP